ncbi:MAG: hypothetical protein NC416_01175 [Eubacterium sp.]|nr:hypothetical protein [Eubacterium sp.]
MTNGITVKTKTNEKIITVYEQNFDNNTIRIIENNGNTIFCPMFSDDQGDIYFLYGYEEIYLKWL